MIDDAKTLVSFVNGVPTFHRTVTMDVTKSNMIYRLARTFFAQWTPTKKDTIMTMKQAEYQHTNKYNLEEINHFCLF